MIVKCNYCGKEFKISDSRYKNSKTKIFHCCKEHTALARELGTVPNSLANAPTMILTCELCGKEFEIKESYYRKQSKRGQTPK